MGEAGRYILQSNGKEKGKDGGLSIVREYLYSRFGTKEREPIR